MIVLNDRQKEALDLGIEESVKQLAGVHEALGSYLDGGPTAEEVGGVVGAWREEVERVTGDIAAMRKLLDDGRIGP